MSWVGLLGGLLKRYAGGSGAAQHYVDRDYGQFARSAPREVMAAGIAEAFRSHETPPFPEMIAKIFSQADPRQRESILDILLRAAPPNARDRWFGPTGPGGRGGDGVSPEHVEELASRVEVDQPGVVEDLGRFLSGHPDLFRSLGSAVLAEILGGAARRTGAEGQSAEKIPTPAPSVNLPVFEATAEG